MHEFGLTRALYLSACKDTDTLYAERVEYDVEWCIRTLARAERIVNSPHPPPRLSDKPDFFKCRFCRHHAVCHEGAMPRVSCRTCIHSTPEMHGDAAWSCARWTKPLGVQEQKDACPAQLFIPSLIDGEQVDCSEEEEWIEYRLCDGTLWRDGAANDNEQKKEAV